MFRRATNTALVIAGAAVSACAESPTQPSLAPAAAASNAAALRWEAIRLANYPGEATAVNSKGQVTGFYFAPNGTRGFVWSNGDLRHVGTLGGTNARPLAINDAGQVVGQSSIPGGLFHAFLWQKGVMRDLGTLGADQSFATAIEPGGRIAGYTEGVDGTLAFIYENGTMKRLAGLDQGYSIAYDIDNMGRVTGVYGSPEAPRAFRWAAGKGERPRLARGRNGHRLRPRSQRQGRRGDRLRRRRAARVHLAERPDDGSRRSRWRPRRRPRDQRPAARHRMERVG